MSHCIKIGTFGLARRNTIGNVKAGDRIALCAAKGDWKIIGFGSATSDYYVSDTQAFLKEGYFPDRFDFKAECFDQEIELVSIIDQLSFVTNLAYWAVFFRKGIVKMSKQDWDLVTKVSKTESLRSHS